MEIEEELASINRDLAYVEGVTIFSLDDDHHRLSSRAVTLLTNLSSINNPAKALGPVSNALCSALVPILIAFHHSRPREKLIDVWMRLVQLVQGAPTPGSLHPMTDAIFAADRGYNSQETVSFLTKSLGATGFGTHKRSLDFPFVFGDGPITRRHKGMVISEKGCRSIYTAKSKDIRSSSRAVHAAVYRESYSERVAAMYHNTDRLFKATKFTLVPKDGFRGEIDARKIYELQAIYDGQDLDLDRSLRTMAGGSEFSGRFQVDLTLQRVFQLTFLQSEDPSWHLLRAFMFTSRTSHTFLATISRNYEDNFSGLARLLKGKTLIGGVCRLSEDESVLQDTLRTKWDSTIGCINIRTGSSSGEPDPVAPSAITSLSDSAINSLTKPQISNILAGAGRRAPVSLRKQELVERLKSLRDAVRAGETSLSEPPVLTEEEAIERHASVVFTSLLKASLESWMMKPLVTTTGMKEGTINEIEVLHNLPNYFNSTHLSDPIPGDTCDMYNREDRTRYKVNFIRSVGLISNKRNQMLGDSPDGLCAISNTDGMNFSAAIEVKTMTAPDSIERAKMKKQDYGGLIVIDDIGISHASNKLFQEIVHTTSYRLQCLHHATVCEVNTVLFVVAKGGSAARGGIIQVAVLNFSESIKNNYQYCLDVIRTAAFEWVGKPSSFIPTEYDGLLGSSYATDLHSLSSYYSLGMALRECVLDGNRPLPPARMIRPTCLVY